MREQQAARRYAKGKPAYRRRCFMSSTSAAREPGDRKRSHFCRLPRDLKRYKLYASCMLWVKPWRGVMHRSDSRQQGESDRRVQRGSNPIPRDKHNNPDAPRLCCMYIHELTYESPNINIAHQMAKGPRERRLGTLVTHTHNIIGYQLRTLLHANAWFRYTPRPLPAPPSLSKLPSRLLFQS